MYSKREDFTMKRVLLLIYILSGLFSIKRSAYAEIAWNTVSKRMTIYSGIETC